MSGDLSEQRLELRSLGVAEAGAEVVLVLSGHPPDLLELGLPGWREPEGARTTVPVRE